MRKEGKSEEIHTVRCWLKRFIIQQKTLRFYLYQAPKLKIIPTLTNSIALQAEGGGVKAFTTQVQVLSVLVHMPHSALWTA
jgi:hypothetical protein